MSAGGRGGLLLACAVLTASAAAARADVVYNVTLDTQSLVGQPGPFAVDFQLTDGSGTGDQNNTVVISNFAFGGGGPLPAFPFSFTPGVAPSSSLAEQVQITDTGFDEFAQAFTPGSSLSFRLRLSTNAESNPDQFTFALLQFDGTDWLNIPTTGLADSFLTAQVGPGGVTLTTGGSSSALPGGYDIAPPQVLPEEGPVGVPEPGTLVVLLAGVPLALAARRAGRAKVLPHSPVPA